MKKKGYYEYDQPIYPHKLCVAIGIKYDDISKCFSNYDGSDIEEYDFKRCVMDIHIGDAWQKMTEESAFC